MAHQHTISGLVGKLITESEVNCNADKYYQIFKHHEDLPSAIPHIYTSVKAVEGHGTVGENELFNKWIFGLGTTSGCVKEWSYILEGKSRTVKEITTDNDETRTINHNGIEGGMMNDYKKFVATLVVKPKANGQGSIVTWIGNYEKINEDSPVPFDYLAFFQQNIEDLNSHLCASD